MTVATKKSDQQRPVNLMEELAEDLLGGLLSKTDESFSANAIRDIKALALNRLWPLYTTSSDGRNYLKRVVVGENVQNDVLRQLKIAMDIVRAHPRD